MGLFSQDAPPVFFYSITFPFPNIGEEIFKQMGTWDEGASAKKNKGSDIGLMRAHYGEVGMGVKKQESKKIEINYLSSLDSY